MNSASSSVPIPAVVLSCLGAPEGDLNVVRSLGEHGVPVTVISEYADPPSGASRHCREFVYLPGYTQAPERLLEALQGLRQRHGTAPVVFPSADPDLTALNQLQSRLTDVVRSTLAPAALIDELMDKRRFNDLALRVGLPVPRTYTPSTMAEVEEVARSAEYPLIVKPSQPVAWKHPDIPLAIARAKAILVEEASELLRICRAVAPHGMELLIQEYIPGGDEEHYDVHAYIDRNGRSLATYSGRKWRIYPPHAGSGCYVESLHIPELEELALDILRKVDYRGIANINFKRHSRTGAYKLLEINPRVSQWNILAARSGVNLPWIAYRDVCGLLPETPPVRRTGVFYLNGKNDLRAFRAYHRMGEWSLGRYISSLLRPGMVYQAWSWADPGPALRLTGGWLATKLGLRRA
jgi:predicted ATP-grasp superfamily ATP-dependent carboligase